METEAATQEARRPGRRARRRQETIEEILDIATEVMTEAGVNGLSLAEVARRLDVKPPAIYKYFPSLLAVYDALFLRAQLGFLAALRDGMAEAEPGLDALISGFEAGGRWCLANRALTQLAFTRPVPSFEPSVEASAPGQELNALHRKALADAVSAGQLGPEANADYALDVVLILFGGIMNLALANEPQVEWGKGRFTPLFPKMMSLVPAAFPLPA